MNVVFYSHNKRNNSLKRPTGGTSISCVLKDSASITAPVLELKIATRPEYNYAHIPDFGRYYYVNEWTYNKGIWTCTLNVDVLTSWRNEILSTTAFIEYSSSDYSLDFTDNRVMSTQEKEISVDEIPSALSIFDADGCYILSVISTDANGYNGACAVYALTQSQLSQFSAAITAQDFLDGIWEGVKNSFNNPFEAIVSCRWIPFSVDSLSGTVKEIIVTYAETGVNGKLLNSNFKSQSFSMNLPRIGENAIFLDTIPFVTAVLYLPFVGTVPVDVDAYYNSNTLSCDMRCDVVTGDIVYTIGSTFDAFTSTYSGNCATQIPLSNNMVDSLGMVASTSGIIGGIVSTVASIALKKTVKTGLLTTGAGVLGAVRSAEVHTSTNGALSSRIGSRISLTFKMVTIRSKVLEIVDSPQRIAAIGLPCNKTLRLSTLSGYCQCSGASVSAPATDAELESINDMINSGIYIE